MAPHLVRWHNKYSDDGLQVIEVFGRSDDRKCGKGSDVVKKHLDDYEVPYAVLFAEPAWIEKTYGVGRGQCGLLGWPRRESDVAIFDPRT